MTNAITGTEPRTGVMGSSGEQRAAQQTAFAAGKVMACGQRYLVKPEKNIGACGIRPPPRDLTR